MSKMSKVLTMILAAATLLGCGLANSYYLVRNYERNQLLTKNIGSPMIQAAIELRNDVYGTVLHGRKNELIYSGKAGNVIKIVYREYSDDYARPAFTQELQYDLSDTKIIKFKRTTIEIINATNQDITFKVLDGRILQFNQGKLSNQDIETLKQDKE